MVAINEEVVLEQLRCAEDFKYFLGKCSLLIAPTMENVGGVRPMEMWPHLIEVANLLMTERLLVWLKSRQVGASWLMAAYVLWYAIFKKGANILLLSKDEVAGVELLDKVRRLENNLPYYLRFEKDEDSKLHIHYVYPDSHLRVFAATETAGVSFTASVIVCDEWEQQRYARRNFDEIKPTIDAGGQFIGIFTPDPENPTSFAKAKFTGALERNNGFRAVFTPYNCVPGRDEKWWQDRYKEASSDGFELDGIGSPDLYMARNYPRSVEEALSPLRTVSAFDRDALDQMMGKTQNPLKTNFEIDKSVCHVYQGYMIGEPYIAASDTAHGSGKDYSVTVIMNCSTGAIVADVYSNVISTDEFALQSFKLLGYYSNPLWYIEDNDWGHSVILTAQNLGYRNLGYADDNKTKVGWHTGENTRYDLFGQLIPAINNGQLTIFNKDGLMQFYDLIRNADKRGRIEAAPGRHDDYPIAVGIAFANRKKVLRNNNVDYKPTFY